MRQTRLSIGCKEWQRIVQTIGAEATGVLLYLRSLMRSMEAAEITIRIEELAGTLHEDQDHAAGLLEVIVAGGHLDRTDNSDGTITLHSKTEAAALAERKRKRSRNLRSLFCPKTGNSNSGPEIPENTIKSFTIEGDIPMAGNSVLKAEQKEKAPHTPQKIKTLTETTVREHTRESEPDLPVDALENEYIDVCATMRPSLRNAVDKAPDDVREAFYLYIRTRKEAGETWTDDRMRIAWLAALRIPEERRAESILAAAMGNWRTIRDAGQGCYFEKGTGRVVSLVRGPIEYRPKAVPNEEALGFLRRMRED